MLVEYSTEENARNNKSEKVMSTALIVGISTYHHIGELPPSVVADALAMADLFSSVTPSTSITLLVNSDATRHNVLDALADMALGGPHDQPIIFYWTGHGGRVASGPHVGEYLLPVDVDCDSNASLAATSVSGDVVTSALRRVSADRLLALFDCCHAGGIGQPKEAAQGAFRTGLTERLYEQIQVGRGRAIIASSRADELSWVMNGAQHSLFTTHLLAGLRGEAADPDGVVRIFDLFEYLQPRVTGDQPQQHPIFKADLEDNFALVTSYPRSPTQEDGHLGDGQYRYDAYISYVDHEPDSSFVWDHLVPRLQASDLRIAVSGDVEQPGVARVVSIERGIAMSRRIVVVLSNDYAKDAMADFENVLAQTMGIEENRYRLLPVIAYETDRSSLPLRLRMLTAVRLDQPQRVERGYQRLVNALHAPLPLRIREK